MLKNADYKYLTGTANDCSLNIIQNHQLQRLVIMNADSVCLSTQRRRKHVTNFWPMTRRFQTELRFTPYLGG